MQHFKKIIEILKKKERNDRQKYILVNQSDSAAAFHTSKMASSYIEM